MTILVTGGGGQVGRELAHLLTDQEIPHAAPTRLHLDITDASALQRAMESARDSQPLTAVIHTAAYTRVDVAENEVDEAYRVNAAASRQIASVCAQFDIPLVYVSTDYVFSGDKGEPYDVEDQTGPVSVYGASKLAGEQAVRELAPKHYVVRTAGVFGPFGHNFPRAILKAAAAGQPLRVVDDQVSSPTYTHDLAEALLLLLGIETSAEGIALRNWSGRPAPHGVYHMSNSGSCSWFRFACEILRQAGWNVDIRPVKSEEFLRPARRPSYSALSLLSIHRVGLYPRSWEDALRPFLARLRPLDSELFPRLHEQESPS